MSQCLPSLEVTKKLIGVIVIMHYFKYHLNCGQEIIFSFENGFYLIKLQCILDVPTDLQYLETSPTLLQKND
jgi:hypothetical protein